MNDHPGKDTDAILSTLVHAIGQILYAGGQGVVSGGVLGGGARVLGNIINAGKPVESLNERAAGNQGTNAEQTNTPEDLRAAIQEAKAGKPNAAQTSTETLPQYINTGITFIQKVGADGLISGQRARPLIAAVNKYLPDVNLNSTEVKPQIYVETDGTNQIVRIELVDFTDSLDYYSAKQGNVGRVYKPQRGGKAFEDVTGQVSKDLAPQAGNAGGEGEHLSHRTKNSGGSDNQSWRTKRASECSVDDWFRREKRAQQKYESIRINEHDAVSISRNTGLSVHDIQEIKNHLFIKEHLFEDGTVGKFATDYEIAIAWERLIDGIQNDFDMVLLKHELYELNYMKAHSCTYEVAHTQANKFYNWSSLVYK